MKNTPRIPVVMFHTVNAADKSWLWDGLTCPLTLFEKKLKSFQARGYRATNLDEVYETQSSGDISPGRSVVLTFDDGYLDNWVYVYPLLKRAGWKGTVYVNPEFVDPGEELRPTLEDVWSGRCAMNDLQTQGFLNWAEIEKMDRDGVLEIASHSMSHTWYPTAADVQDFHRPGLDTPWLGWNARPERKSFYRVEDQSEYTPWGTPIHTNGRSLGIRQFFPDHDVAVATVEHVKARGGQAFFSKNNWREELISIAQEADQGRGREETDAEMTVRFEYEINEASRIIDARLGRRVKHFCWPGGAYCDEAWSIAEAAGYHSITVTRSDRRRWQGFDPRVVRRISEYRQYSFLGRRCETSNPMLLPVACDVELGRLGADIELRFRKGIASLAGSVFPSR